MSLVESERHSSKLTEALVLARTRASDLESVRKLNCWASNLENVSIVRNMPNLEVCSLSVNNLTTLEDFAHCPNLRELYVRKNHVKSLSDIHYLRSLKRLRALWLSDNPCAEGEKYRMTVLKTLPNLQKLDNIAVTEEELNCALEEGEELPFPPGLCLNNSTDNIANIKDDFNTSPKSTCADNILGDEEEDKDKAGKIANHANPDISDSRLESGSSGFEHHRQSLLQEDSLKLSLEETNNIRAQLGLKPLPISKVVPHKSVATGVTKARNANILQSVLLLLGELDKDSLEIVNTAVHQKLENM